MFNLNKSSVSNLVALDINKEHVSILELSSKGKSKTVENFNVLPAPSTIFIGSKISNLDLLINTIEKLISHLKLKTKDVKFAIPEELSLKHVFTIEKKMTDYDIENYIVANFEKFFSSMDIDDVYMDFHELGENKKAPNKKDILLVVAKKIDVDLLEDAISSSGLNPVSIDLTCYALERMIKFYKTKEENQVLAYFDIKKTKTDIHFFENAKRVYYQESEEFSLDMLILDDDKNEDEDKDKDKEVKKIKEAKEKEQISNSGEIDLDLDMEEEEKVIIPEVEEDIEKEIVISDEELKTNDDVMIASKQNQQFYDFIQNMLYIFYSMGDYNKVDKIVLSGDITSFNINIDLLEKELGTKLISAQPFSKMKISKSVNSDKVEKFSSNLGVLVGLAMSRDYDDIDINIHDWRSEKREKQNKGFQTKLGLYISVCIGILASGHFFYSDAINVQTLRNAEIKTVISNAESELLNIDSFKAQKENMVRRIKTINGLQVERPIIVNIFTTIVDSMPKETYLLDFNRMDTGFILIRGIAYRESRVFELIKNLETSKWFHNVKITKIQNVKREEKESNSNYYSEQNYEFEIELTETKLEEIQE
jgi:type IV pilus assembly protein PilM